MIFIHVPKTGGTSVKKVLMGYKEGTCACKQTHITSHDHLTALNIQKSNPGLFKKFFKFSIVRNPYDRLVSEFHWRAYNKQYTFAKFIRGLPDGSKTSTHLKPQHLFIYDKDNKTLLVDQVVRFEKYNSEIVKLYRKHKVKYNPRLAKINNTEHKNYAKYYTPELYKIVNNVYKLDFEIFNYKMVN